MLYTFINMNVIRNFNLMIFTVTHKIIMWVVLPKGFFFLLLKKYSSHGYPWYSRGISFHGQQLGACECCLPTWILLHNIFWMFTFWMDFGGEGQCLHPFGATWGDGGPIHFNLFFIVSGFSCATLEPVPGCFWQFF